MKRLVLLVAVAMAMAVVACGGSGGGAPIADPPKAIDCVAEWVKIDLAAPVPCRRAAPPGSGCSSVEARDLVVGDMVWTRPEGGGEYGAYPVVAVAPGTAPMLTAVAFGELHGIRGAALQFSSTHQLLVEGKGWTEVQNLVVGDVISGSTPTEVLSVEALGASPVVQITIGGAHTYETWGVASHDTVVEP
jgi:hypothetical protein